MSNPKKKKYTAPDFCEYQLDKDISLVLMSSTEEDPKDPPGPMAAPSSGTFQENPFDESKLK